MKMHDERHVNLDTYRPLPEDDDGLTPRQIHERRAAVRRASFLRYSSDMTRTNAEAVLALPMAELMRRLELDGEQAGDLKVLAKRHLELCELAGVR